MSKRLKAKGKDVVLTEYDGAVHVFDGQMYKKPLRVEKAQTVRECKLAESDNGVIINLKTGAPFTYADPCVQYGTTLAYDEKAATDVRKAIRDFVTTTLKAK